VSRAVSVAPGIDWSFGLTLPFLVRFCPCRRTLVRGLSESAKVLLMPGNLPCPDEHVLKGFLLRKVPCADLEILARHVEQCHRCVGILQAMDPRDALLNTMQEPAVAVQEQLNPFTALLIARCCDLGLAPTAKADATQEMCDFLAPSQEPGEIGRLG